MLLSPVCVHQWHCCGVMSHNDWYAALHENVVPDRCCQQFYQGCGRNASNTFWTRVSVCDVLKVVLCDVHYYCKSKARVPKLFPLNLGMYVGPKRIPSSHKWMTSFSNLCSEKSNISTSLLETPGGPNWILWQVNLNMSACWEMHLIAILPGVGWEEWIHSHVLYFLWCYSHPTSLA